MDDAVESIADGIIEGSAKIIEKFLLHEFRKATVKSSNTVTVDGVDYIPRCERILTVGKIVLVMFYNGKRDNKNCFVISS